MQFTFSLKAWRFSNDHMWLASCHDWHVMEMFVNSMLEFRSFNVFNTLTLFLWGLGSWRPLKLWSWNYTTNCHNGHNGSHIKTTTLMYFLIDYHLIWVCLPFVQFFKKRQFQLYCIRKYCFRNDTSPVVFTQEHCWLISQSCIKFPMPFV